MHDVRVVSFMVTVQPVRPRKYGRKIDDNDAIRIYILMNNFILICVMALFQLTRYTTLQNG